MPLLIVIASEVRRQLLAGPFPETTHRKQHTIKPSGDITLRIEAGDATDRRLTAAGENRFCEFRQGGSRLFGRHPKLTRCRCKSLSQLRVPRKNEDFVIWGTRISGALAPIQTPVIASWYSLLIRSPLEQMRIAFFTETFLPKMDGIVTTLCQTIRQLGELGHQVLLFAPDGGISEFEQARVVGMRSRAFPLYPELRLGLPRASMRKVLTEFQPDILHVVDPAVLGIAGLYYGGGNDGGPLRVPLVVSYHTDWPKYINYYGLGFLEPYVWKMLRARHRRANINLCTSSQMVNQLELHGIRDVALWPGGVDADMFRPSRKSAELRYRLTDGHPDSPLLLYVGRLSAEKNLESLRPVLQSFPKARLALVGDGPHRQDLEGHFARLPVHFAGYLYKNELAAAFASSDIFVMPSRTETLGLVVLEAMSSGLPVVAARAGGLTETIEDGVSGYLVGSEDEAAARVGELLGSAQKRGVMGEQAREQASRRSWREATLRLVEHYREAIERQAQRPAGSAAVPRGVHASTGRAMRRAAMFAIRNLLP